MKNVNKQLTEIQKLHLDTALRVMEMTDEIIFSQMIDGARVVNTQMITHVVDIAAHIIGAVESYGSQK